MVLITIVNGYGTQITIVFMGFINQLITGGPTLLTLDRHSEFHDFLEKKYPKQQGCFNLKNHSSQNSSSNGDFLSESARIDQAYQVNSP